MSPRFLRWSFVGAMTLTACREGEVRRFAPVARDASAVPVAAVASAIPVPAPDPVMDATFRDRIATPFLAQVRRGEWGAFVPRGGVLSRNGTIHSLSDSPGASGGRRAHAERLCSARALKAAHAEMLLRVANDLEARDRKPDDGRFTCEGDSCSLHGGEGGFNGSFVFARDGEFVRLVSTHSYCGGAHDAETTAEMEEDERAVREPRPCAAIQR